VNNKKPPEPGPGNVSSCGPRKKDDAETVAHHAAAANRAAAEGRVDASPPEVLCPMMSSRIAVSNAAALTTKEGLMVPGIAPQTIPVMVPCLRERCGRAIGNPEFGFVGCGLMAAGPDVDVVQAIDRFCTTINRVLSAGPGLASGMIAMQGATLELKRMLSAVGLTHSEITKQTTAVTKLINYLIERMEKPLHPPGK